jgi:hypothetical protein
LTTAPNVKITSPAANSVFKSSLTLSGPCVNGLTVNISGSGISSSSTANCASGAFSASLNLSSGDGAKAISVAQTDAAGNTGTDSRGFVRDTVAPDLSITAPAANAYVGSGITLAGACETGITVNVSGAATGTAACVSSAYSSTFTLSSGDGAKSVTVSQTDAAGNTASVSRSFTKDTTQPALTIASPAAGTNTKSTIALTGACENGLAVGFTGSGLASSSSVNCANGAYSSTLSLSSGDGNKSITVAQTDAAGNAASVTRSFVKDTQAPALAISGPAAGTSAETGLTVTGTCEASYNVTAAGTGISSSVTQACASGQFSIAVVFTSGDGTKPVTVSQTDAAGNTGSVSRDFTRQAPVSLDGAALYTQNCALCHGALASSVKKGKTAAQITGAIATIPMMAGLSTLTAAQIQAISTALGMSTTPSNSGVSEYDLTLGGRTYMNSLLRQVFVASSGATTDDINISNILSTLILSQPVAMGGPCTVHDEDCPSAQAATAPLANSLPTGNTMRKGYTTRACEQVLEIDKSVRNVLAKAGLSETSTANNASYQALFTAFHPGVSPSTEVLNALNNVATDAKNRSFSNLDMWRFVVLPICLSSTLDIL